MSPIECREVLDGQLLPALDGDSRSDQHLEGLRVNKVARVADAVVGHDGKDGITTFANLRAGSSNCLWELQTHSIDIEQPDDMSDVVLRECLRQPQILPDELDDLLLVPPPLLGVDVRLLQVVHQLVGPQPLVTILLHEEQHAEDGDVRVCDVELVLADVVLPGGGGGEEVALPAVSVPLLAPLVTQRVPAAPTPDHSHGCISQREH